MGRLTSLLELCVVVNCILSVNAMYWEFGKDSDDLEVLDTFSGSIAGFKYQKNISLRIPECMVVTYALVEVYNHLSTPNVEYNFNDNSVTIWYKWYDTTYSTFKIKAKGRRKESPACDPDTKHTDVNCKHSLTTQTCEIGKDSDDLSVLANLSGKIGSNDYSKRIPLEIPECMIVKYILVEVYNPVNEPYVDYDFDKKYVKIDYGRFKVTKSKYTIKAKGQRKVGFTCDSVTKFQLTANKGSFRPRTKPPKRPTTRSTTEYRTTGKIHPLWWKQRYPWAFTRKPQAQS